MKYLLICAGLLLIVFHSWGQERLADRIAPPSGYVRETCSDNSFTTYLRNLPLLPKGSKVLLYNGKEKANQAAAFAVVDMEIGNRDLQQCADAVIRLRAEYLWKHKRYADIKFNFTSGFTAEYKKWAEGNRIKVNDNQVQWYASGKGVDYSYKTFVTISIWFLCMPELPLYLVNSQLCFILPCNPGMSLLKAVHPVML